MQKFTMVILFCVVATIVTVQAKPSPCGTGPYGSTYCGMKWQNYSNGREDYGDVRGNGGGGTSGGSNFGGSYGRGGQYGAQGGGNYGGSYSRPENCYGDRCNGYGRPRYTTNVGNGHDMDNHVTYRPRNGNRDANIGNGHHNTNYVTIDDY